MAWRSSIQDVTINTILPTDNHHHHCVVMGPTIFIRYHIVKSPAVVAAPPHQVSRGNSQELLTATESGVSQLFCYPESSYSDLLWEIYKFGFFRSIAHVFSSILFCLIPKYNIRFLKHPTTHLRVCLLYSTSNNHQGLSLYVAGIVWRKKLLYCWSRYQLFIEL